MLGRLGVWVLGLVWMLGVAHLAAGRNAGPSGPAQATDGHGRRVQTRHACRDILPGLTSPGPTMPTSSEIRRQFIDFFEHKHGHAFVASSPVVPHDDPTLLFTNAGMNQFKPYFLGTGQAPWKRVANTQKCIRAGGKHNDLDDVGRSRRHHTFFEMLGNWSFGDYFKEGAIAMAWELLTQVWGLDPERLHISCFEGDPANGVPRDTEAAEIWQRVCGVPAERIHYFGKDNFWEMGDTGPCGPCTEIYIDRTPDKTGGKDVNGEDPRVMEIWNLVFIQYNRDQAGTLTPLPAQHVDTGMGFERICQVLQDKQDNFGIDLWDPFFAAIGGLSGKRYTGQYPKSNVADPEAEAADPQLRTDIAFRVIADHLRCLTFALTDGATPSNEGRGYVLRRILRRAVRFGRQQLGLGRPFLHELVPVVVESMGDAFPELKKNASSVADTILEEEESFGKTIERGIALFEEAAGSGTSVPAKQISADNAFKLYDTYGFPVDLTQVMAAERGMTVDMEGFDRLMEQARERSRGVGGGADLKASLVDVVQKHGGELGATAFVGYEITELMPRSTRLHLFVERDGAFVAADRAERGQRVAVVVDQTPFYAEAGGQVGDSGTLQVAGDGGGRVSIDTTVRVGEVIFHLGTVVAPIAAGAHNVALAVDRVRRARIMANHTSTHVMNLKLRAVLGDHVQQKGSLVDESRLRFDFSHNAAMTPEEIDRVEEGVTHDIAADLPVYTEHVPQDEAVRVNTLRAVFGEKYPPTVRVVSIGVPVQDLLSDPKNAEWMRYSVEFCGGTHLATTGDAEGFVIVGEEGVAKGVRRLTALTGAAAHQAAAEAEALQNRLDMVNRSGSAGEGQLRSTVAELTRAMGETQLPLRARGRLQQGLAELQARLKQIEKDKSKTSAGEVVELARHIAEAGDDEVIVARLEGADAGALRTAMDVIRKKRPEAAMLLAGVAGEKVALLASVPPEKVKAGLKAGDWIKAVAPIVGGGGGGRPDMAQAGGKDPSKLDEALDAAREFAGKPATDARR
jgi:alanyl-tRNA synthetase